MVADTNLNDREAAGGRIAFKGFFPACGLPRETKSLCVFAFYRQ
jgi:hypothetical protein